MLQLVVYDRTYLDRSYDWLCDPETKALTMTPDFTRDDQTTFFAKLPSRTDYKIWGIAVDGRPAGAAGIKHITGPDGEYWGYLGEKILRGQGLGAIMLAAIEEKARDLGLHRLHLHVSHENERAIRLYQRTGYNAVSEQEFTLRMEKTL